MPPSATGNPPRTPAPTDGPGNAELNVSAGPNVVKRVWLWLSMGAHTRAAIATTATDQCIVLPIIGRGPRNDRLLPIRQRPPPGADRRTLRHRKRGAPGGGRWRIGRSEEH